MFACTSETSSLQPSKAKPSRRTSGASAAPPSETSWRSLPETSSPPLSSKRTSKTAGSGLGSGSRTHFAAATMSAETAETSSLQPSKA